MLTVKLVATAMPATLFAIAQLHAPQTPNAEAESRSAFQSFELTSIGDNPKSVRRVHPDLEPLAGWISAVGAGVALFDFDQDGRANDYCLVDPRFDSVTIAPVATTGGRFAPFILDWSLAGSEGDIAPMGCLPADLDSDGAMDLVVYYWGRAPSLHLAVDSFAERPLMERFELWHSNAAVVSDFNGDGHLDLAFGNYFPDSFTVLGDQGRGQMQHSMSRAQNAGRNRLFLGDGEAGFSDASDALNAAAPEGWTLAMGAADLDGDQLPELYIGNDFGPDHLLHNRTEDGQLRFARVTGSRGFMTPRSRVLGKDSFKGMGIDFGDFNRDGILDLFVSNIAEDYALMESHLLFEGTGDVSAFAKGRAPYVERSGQRGVARSSWSWDARIQDFDGDGWPEIVQATGFLRGTTDRWAELHEVAMGNDELLRFPQTWAAFSDGADLSGDRRDAFFQRGPDGQWIDVGLAVGFESGTVSRGLATGDIDGDGDPDLLIARQWQPSLLLLNTAAPKRFATLAPRIQLPDGQTRPAHGAQVTLLAGEETMTEIVPGGEGHSGKSAPEVHFGLGDFPPTSPVQARIRWRQNGSLQEAVVAVEPGHATILLQAEKTGGL